MPGVRVEQLEQAVVRAIAAERVTPDVLDQIEAGIGDVIADLQAAERITRDTLAKHLAKLALQEGRLIDALAEGDLPVPQLRERLQQLTLQKGAIEERLARTEDSPRYGAERAQAAIGLVRDPGALYEALPVTSRRELLQALFRRLRAKVSDTGTRTEQQRTAGNQALHELSSRFSATEEAAQARPNEKIPGKPAEDLDVEREGFLSQVIGLNKTNLVAEAGLEPATSRL